jgi:hypothetical protein
MFFYQLIMLPIYLLHVDMEKVPQVVCFLLFFGCWPPFLYYKLDKFMAGAAPSPKLLIVSAVFALLLTYELS